MKVKCISTAELKWKVQRGHRNLISERYFKQWRENVSKLQNICFKVTNPRITTVLNFLYNHPDRSNWRTTDHDRPYKELFREIGEITRKPSLDWEWSSGWLKSLAWEGLLLATDVWTTCVEAIFRVKWSLLVSWKFKNLGERFDWAIDRVNRSISRW